MAMEGLGRSFDLVPSVVPVDINTADSATGSRVHLKNYSGCAIVFYKGAGGDEDATLTLREHDAASAGNSQDLAIVDHYYHKREATLDGDETWTRATQTAAATVTSDGDVEELLVIEVDAKQLSDGFEWLSLNVSGTFAASQLVSVLYVMRDLDVQRAPANLANPNA